MVGATDALAAFCAASIKARPTVVPHSWQITTALRRRRNGPRHPVSLQISQETVAFQRRSNHSHQVGLQDPNAVKAVRNGYSRDARPYVCMWVVFNPLKIGSCPLSPHSRCRGAWRTQGSATIVVFLERKTPEIDRFCT